MNKSTTAKRIFSLGDYQNIEFTDTITEIPEELALNHDAMRLVRYLQLVDIEWSYIRYMKLRASTPKLTNIDSIEQAIEFIEEERTRTFNELLEQIKK